LAIPAAAAENELVSRRVRTIAAVGGAGLGIYSLLVRGALTVDLGIALTVRSLGPLAWRIAAPRDLVSSSSRLPTSAGRRARSSTSCACSTAARTWFSPSTTRRLDSW
jgi:hypothetical protein